MAQTEIEICQVALRRVGDSQTITDTSGGLIANSADTTLEVRLLKELYPRARNQLLEALPWPFATKFALLTENDDGTNEIWDDEHDFAYALPADCLVARRFVTNTHQREPNPEPFRIFQHDSGTVIACNVANADANLEYTALVTDDSLYPEMFCSALSWKIAYEIALPLSVDRQLRSDAMQMYAVEMRMAAARVFNEETPYPYEDGLYVRSRMGYFRGGPYGYGRYGWWGY